LEQQAFYSICIFLSADWSIEMLLRKWNLECRHISLTSFGGDDENIAGSDLINNHSIQMLVITCLGN
jgi:hypothetical protein